MIKLQNLVPEVYYRQSRDFQFIGRLFDVVLNSAKTNADIIYDIPLGDSADTKLIDLLALTLGFKVVHSYNIKQLAAVCSILPQILRYKGTLKAINMVCQAVVTAENLSLHTVVSVDPDDKNNLLLYIPQSLSDINLITDLFDYILPAGMTYNIKRTTVGTTIKTLTGTKTASWINKMPRYNNNKAIVTNTDEISNIITKIEDTGDHEYPGLMSNSVIVSAEKEIQDEDNTND